MAKRFVAAMALVSCISNTYAQQHETASVNIGIIYPLSTNNIRAWQCSNVMSLNIIAGISASEKAFCVAGVANVVRDSAAGFMAAGVTNVTAGRVSGLQVAGAVNTAGSVTGMQVAGCANVTGSVTGTQVAGFANVVSGNVRGSQIAGFINKARHVNTQIAGFVCIAQNVRGLQAAGFDNTAKGNVEGAQLAGFSNQATNARVQVAGFINTAGEVSGIQAAGFINVAKKVKGVQLSGFINVADSSDYPIGLVNLIKKGEKVIGVNVDETGTTMATFRSGGRIMYGMVGAGINNYKSNGLYAVGAGIGAHLPISKHFRCNVEAAVNTLTGFDGKYFFNSGLRIFPSLRFARVEVFAGPSANFATYTRSLDIIPNNISLWTDRRYGEKQNIYLGFISGVQFHI